MEKLWAPWRRKFIYHQKNKDCIFCSKPRSRNDRNNLILERGKAVYSILNLYPYNNGHVMIAPYRHLKDVSRLTQEETLELFDMLKRTLKTLSKALKPHGYNVGFNLGRVAGAGFDKHVHLHVVPRWLGDTSFMPVLADAKVISESLTDLRKRFLACKP
ncbi:MAG: HIT family protein [Candidatus Omnitrophota bacterium]